MRLPDNHRLVLDDERADVEYLGELNVDALHKAFLAQVITRAYEDSWWIHAGYSLKQRGADPRLADNLTVVARHDVQIGVNENTLNQGFEVFELGDPEDDTGVIGTVPQTLNLIDQFSGGLLSADPRRPRIALANGIRLAQARGAGEIGGFNEREVMLINMSALKETALEHGADLHPLLATVIVHELLGHTLESLTEGSVGIYFRKYFNYSDDHTPGHFYDTVHSAIEPLDPSIVSSPVREYGQVRDDEDLATSTDTTIGDAMGWKEEVDKIPRWRGQSDAYRAGLVTELMEVAAEAARRYDGTPGFVGSEIRYTTDINGYANGVVPVRKMSVSHALGREAAQEELQKVINKYRPGDELLVSPGDFM